MGAKIIELPPSGNIQGARVGGVQPDSTGQQQKNCI